MFALRRGSPLAPATLFMLRAHVLALWSVLLAGVGGSAGCHRQRVTQSDQRVALASVDFGDVEVGTRARRKTVLPLGRVPVLLELEQAPADVEAPPRLFTRPGEPAWLTLRWRPSSAGQLDAQVTYRMSVGPSETTLRIQLFGEAWSTDVDEIDASAEAEVDASEDASASVTACSNQDDCDDYEACTEDTCDPALGCLHQPRDEGQPCGPFDCTIGHFCAAGACNAVDMREVSDGMRCDDADPCTQDGSCRDGLCYASSEPRRAQVLDTLPTFGEGMSDAAHSAGTYVFVGLDRIDVVSELAGTLLHRARLALRGVAFVESVDRMRFLVRTSDGQVLRLDTHDPAAPKLTPLPHIVPLPSVYLDKPDVHASFDEKWAVVGEWVVIATTSATTPEVPEFHGVTIAPIATGAARGLAIPLYRVAAADNLLAWAQPGIRGTGDDAMGVLRFEGGAIVTDTRITLADVQRAGCAQPKYVAISGNWLATLARTESSGASALCLWKIGERAQSLTLAAAHPLYDNAVDPAIALDQEALYLANTTWLAPGWGGAPIGKGQLKRLLVRDLLANSDVLSFQGMPAIAPHAGSLLKLSDARLLVAGDALSVLRTSGEPVTGPGHGLITGALSVDQGRRALLGGRSSFGLLDVMDHAPKLSARHWVQHYPKSGGIDFDLRNLQAEGQTKNLTPVSRAPAHDATRLEQLTAHANAEGTLQVSAQTRVLPVHYGWVSSTLTEGALTLHADGTLLVFGARDTREPSRSFSLPHWARPTGWDANVFLRPTSSATSLSIVQADQLSWLDPLTTPDSATLTTQRLPPTLAPSALYSAQSLAQNVAVDGDRVLRGEANGLVLYSKLGLFAPARLVVSDTPLALPIQVPAFGSGWALASYRDVAGQSWLVQVSVEDSALHEFARLRVEGTVQAVDRVGERWVVSTSAGVHLVDLMCFPGDER